MSRIPLTEQIAVVEDYLDVLCQRVTVEHRPEALMRPIIAQWEAVLDTLKAVQAGMLGWLLGDARFDDAEDAGHE